MIDRGLIAGAAEGRLSGRFVGLLVQWLRYLPTQTRRPLRMYRRAFRNEAKRNAICARFRPRSPARCRRARDPGPRLTFFYCSGGKREGRNLLDTTSALRFDGINLRKPWVQIPGSAPVPLRSAAIESRDPAPHWDAQKRPDTSANGSREGWAGAIDVQ
jgi:hypothetical protein